MDWLKEWYQVIAGAVLMVFWQASLEYRVGETSRRCDATHKADEILNAERIANLTDKIKEVKLAVEKIDTRQDENHKELVGLIQKL